MCFLLKTTPGRNTKLDEVRGGSVVLALVERKGTTIMIRFALVAPIKLVLVIRRALGPGRVRECTLSIVVDQMFLCQSPVVLIVV